MKQINVVAAIIYNHNKILITKRKGSKFDGLWEFPGGKIESNDNSKIEALKREIKEELEIEIKVDNHFDYIEYDYGDFYLKMDVYKCSINENQEIIMNVHEDYKWININELKEFDWVPADILIVNKLIEEDKQSI